MPPPASQADSPCPPLLPLLLSHHHSHLLAPNPPAGFLPPEAAGRRQRLVGPGQPGGHHLSLPRINAAFPTQPCRCLFVILRLAWGSWGERGSLGAGRGASPRRSSCVRSTLCSSEGEVEVVEKGCEHHDRVCDVGSYFYFIFIFFNFKHSYSQYELEFI